MKPIIQLLLLVITATFMGCNSNSTNNMGAGNHVYSEILRIPSAETAPKDLDFSTSKIDPVSLMYYGEEKGRFKIGQFEVLIYFGYTTYNMEDGLRPVQSEKRIKPALGAVSIAGEAIISRQFLSWTDDSEFDYIPEETEYVFEKYGDSALLWGSSYPGKPLNKSGDLEPYLIRINSTGEIQVR